MSRAESRTNREDWLTAALADRAHVFVSGSPSFADRAQMKWVPVLRVAGHFPQGIVPPEGENRQSWLPPYYKIMTLFMTLEMPTQQDVDAYAPSSADLNILEWVRRTFNLPIDLVAYPAQYNEAGLFDRIWVDAGGAEKGLMSPQQYADQLNQQRAGLKDEEPARQKLVNKTVNDPFQRLTRSLLSRQLAINDLDALVVLDGTIAVIELKRSNMRPWAPFLDDVPNFILMRSLSRAIPLVFDVLVQYSETITVSAHLHHILGIDRERLTGYGIEISGTDGPNVVEHLVERLQNPTPRAYSSQNRIHR